MKRLADVEIVLRVGAPILEANPILDFGAMRSAIERAIDTFPKTRTGIQCAEVLRYRYPRGGVVRTLEEVAAEYGLTRERIRQVEYRAIRYLCHRSRQKLIVGPIEYLNLKTEILQIYDRKARQ